MKNQKNNSGIGIINKYSNMLKKFSQLKTPFKILKV